MQISLIEFSVRNFKVFKEKATFSMVARKSGHTFENNGENLLRTSLIFGPNASGKSTLLLALQVIKDEIIQSAKNEVGASLPFLPFLLSDLEEKNPSFFEIVFSLDKVIYKYNFSILKDRVTSENLFEILSDGKEREHFTRVENKINLFEGFKKSEDLKTKTRKEALFLSVASQWNNSVAVAISKGFRDINVVDVFNFGNGSVVVNLLEQDREMKKLILDFLKRADFCINDIKLEEIKIPNQVLSQMRSFNMKGGISGVHTNKANTVILSHDKYNKANEVVGSVELNLADESIGTQRFFNVLGPVIDTIQKGKVLFIDEFDGSLHPYLTKFIVDIFENNNPKNAQLVATTHDISLLSYKDDFDKAQFWFTEKDKFGSGKIFSLAEFTDVRNDTEFSKKYLDGRFGGLPFIEK